MAIVGSTPEEGFRVLVGQSRRHKLLLKGYHYFGGFYLPLSFHVQPFLDTLCDSIENIDPMSRTDVLNSLGFLASDMVWNLAACTCMIIARCGPAVLKEQRKNFLFSILAHCYLTFQQEVTVLGYFSVVPA